MLRTFRHGTHPPTKKVTRDLALVDFDVPQNVFVSLSQHIGAPASAIVQVGDRVLQGQMIAKAAGFVSAHVFSPISGVVKAFVTLPTATGAEALHVQIENDGLYEKCCLPPLENADREQILQRIADAGIVGMGGATFPTHVKLAPKQAVDTLIINGAECEPYISCDYRLMVEHAKEIAKGIGYLMTALDVKQAFVGIEANKSDAVKVLAAELPQGAVAVKLKTKYPQGAEKQLIYALTSRKVEVGALPAQVGCVVCNVHTAYAVAKAVSEGEPLYKRAMTVAGGGVQNVGNFWVRTGTPYSFVYEKCRGEVDSALTKKVISGGPMMGFAQANLSATCTKGTSALLFLTEKEFNHSEATQCINCGHCIQHCPMQLMPRDIEHAVQKNDIQKAYKLGVNNCIECGVCSYICPARRPLVQAMRLAKKDIRTKGVK